MKEEVDFSLLSGQDNKEVGFCRSESECPHPYNEKFADWVMVDKGIKKRDSVGKAYRIREIQREYGVQITALPEAEKISTLSSHQNLS